MLYKYLKSIFRYESHLEQMLTIAKNEVQKNNFRKMKGVLAEKCTISNTDKRLLINNGILCSLPLGALQHSKKYYVLVIISTKKKKFKNELSSWFCNYLFIILELSQLQRRHYLTFFLNYHISHVV